jgi:DNA modification methylase
MSDAIDGRLYGKGLLGDIKPKSLGPLRDRFRFSPFSVFNTREDRWQDRKRRWLELGIQSEVGRDDKLTFNIPIELTYGRTGNKIRNQTSIFDPVLCELIYRWWSPPGGVVVDPFAGGSVRGIIASILDRKYWGGELRQEQVDANRIQAENPDLHGRWKPKWVCGDSTETIPKIAPCCDFFFSCPPYGNLEVYSDNPADLSNKKYKQFITDYGDIIAEGCRKLNDDRFACFVVGNFRDRDTREMRDFAGDTTRAFQRAGLQLYNEAILINAVGSGAMRANGTFLRGNGKLVKSHQNILVYVKGDPAKAFAPIKETLDMGAECSEDEMEET